MSALALSPALAAQGRPQAPRAWVAIWEIYYNSPGKDTGSNASLNHEWVLLHNTTGRPVTLAHWTLRDTAGHVFTFGSYQLKAHGYVRTGPGTSGTTTAARPP